MKFAESLLPGFNNAVLDSQHTFRVVMGAMARPGKVLMLPVLPKTPSPLYQSTGAVALTLFDLDTPVWTDALLSTPQVVNYLQFHCGCPFTQNPATAAFALIGAGAAMPPLGLFAASEPLAPERSTTVIIQVTFLTNREGRRLTGPGIAESIDLEVAGLSESFWESFQENHELFPQGVDVLLLSPTSLCGLPRTVSVSANRASGT